MRGRHNKGQGRVAEAGIRWLRLSRYRISPVAGADASRITLLTEGWASTGEGREGKIVHGKEEGMKQSRFILTLGMLILLAGLGYGSWFELNPGTATATI
jgi:hypothetical protein